MKPEIHAIVTAVNELTRQMAVDADRIERLEAAVRRIADLTERWEHDLISQVNEIARKALEGKDDRRSN